MDSELLLKFTEYFPDCLSALSYMLLRFSWTTFVETAVCKLNLTESMRTHTEQAYSGTLSRLKGLET